MGKADETRERILDAALGEFSAYGVAGARVDRIARNAGCNKNLIYIYFGNKEDLFTTVLRTHLLRVYEELEFTPDDLPGYAGRVFDFAMTHPGLMRLMTWSALEGPAGSPAERTSSRGKKIGVMTSAGAARQEPGGLPPAFLLTAIMALATAWNPASPFGPVLDPAAAADLPGLRRNVVAAVRLLTAPGRRA